jgi:hypothetical protein
VSFRIFSQGEWKVKLVTEWVEEDKVKLWSILQQREIIKYCDEVIFTILQHRNHDTDSNEIRPMGCARIGKTER